MDEMRIKGVERALEVFGAGGAVIVQDDGSRENEGDLIMAAEHMTTERMAFMVKYTSGLICCPMKAERAAKLGLPPMWKDNEDLHHTAFTVSVDALSTTTGISARDRAETVRRLSDPSSTKATFRRPGHMFPLVAREEGLRERRGHTEAAIALCRLCGPPAVHQECAVIGELVNGDDLGEMMRSRELAEFANQHQLPLITVDDLVQYEKHLAGPQEA